MAQFPFTDQGAAQKLQELYALSDGELLTQAKAITFDLGAWLNQNFTLTDQQQAYVASLPATVSYVIGAAVGAAVASRSPITMGTPPGKYGPPRRTKQIKINPCGQLWYFPPISGSSTVGGSLPVTIEYSLVD